jgi:hypothetical protein
LDLIKDLFGLERNEKTIKQILERTMDLGVDQYFLTDSHSILSQANPMAGEIGCGPIPFKFEEA